MVDWANEQLSMLQGQLTFLKLGSARIFYRHICSDENDVTDVYVELMERCIEQWTDLMVQHNIPVHFSDVARAATFQTRCMNVRK